MDIFKAVCEARRDHGYCERDYARYSRHARNMAKSVRKREGVESPLFMIYLSENYIAKHFLARRQKNARKQMRKALRTYVAAEKCAPDLAGTFSLYCKGLEHMQRSRYKEAAELLLKARQVFLCSSEIRGEIENMLYLCSQNADTELERPRKIARKWHDIELYFGNEEEIRAFFNCDSSASEDDSFESLLKGRILRVESSKRKLLRLMKKGACRLRCLHAKSRAFLDEVREFNVFISKNYVKSDFAAGLERDAADMCEFLGAVVLRSKGDMSRAQVVLDFRVPDAFREVESFVETIRCSAELDTTAVREKLLGELEKLVSVQEGISARIPFFPVFYDLAYDFIEYPGTKYGGSRISEFVSKLSSLSFKK